MAVPDVRWRRLLSVGECAIVKGGTAEKMKVKEQISRRELRGNECTGESGRCGPMRLN